MATETKADSTIGCRKEGVLESMYLIQGIKPGGRLGEESGGGSGRESGGGSGEAPLRYDTLDEALQKVRDLIEADEIDEDGRMFASYVLSFDHPAAGDLTGRTALRHGVAMGEGAGDMVERE